MIRPSAVIAALTVSAAVLCAPLAHAQGATPKDPWALDGPPPARVRVILNAGFWASGPPAYADTRTFEEYAEQTTIRTSYETEGRFGPDVAVQVGVFRGWGLLVGYSRVSRDVSGAVDVSRPHPLYLDRPRAASAGISGYGYSEGALHLDLAFGRGAGHLDWSVFAGLTLFQVEADVLDEPAYTDVYPYDELSIQSTPGRTLKESPTGFNVGGRIDYRFGRSGRIGLGAQVLYGTASVELVAGPDTTSASFDVGGLQVGAGVRIYF